MPRKAITMGLGTILKAKRIILMAWGEEKATVIKDIVEGEENFGYAGDLPAKSTPISK